MFPGSFYDYPTTKLFPLLINEDLAPDEPKTMPVFLCFKVESDYVSLYSNDFCNWAYLKEMWLDFTSRMLLLSTRLTFYLMSVSDF